MTEFEKEYVIQHFEIELSKYSYNSETLNNKGLRTIYGRKAQMLSLLLHMAKKQIPKKPLNPCGRYFGKAKGGNCPCCGAHINSITNNYCRKCGQKLLWE